jgi:hypothetical protein
VVKLLWLTIINIEDKRAREPAARRPATGRRSDQPARLVEGQRTMGWREALNELDNACGVSKIVKLSGVLPMSSVHDHAPEPPQVSSLHSSLEEDCTMLTEYDQEPRRRRSG